MNKEPWEVKVYIAQNGDCPFDEWLATLSRQEQQRIDARLLRIKKGNFGDYKAIGEGLYELRFFFGPGYRVYYAIVGTQIVLLLAGGSKKRQSEDIRRAKRFLETYKSSS